MRWWSFRSTKVIRLRSALADAISHCPTCNGSGAMVMAGGVMMCNTCGYWRRVLRETK